MYTIRLHWGIKKKFRKTREFFDTHLILPICGLLFRHLYKGLVYHYGGDYRGSVGGEKSHNLDNATSNLGYGLFHYAFIRNIRPKRVLCIGSMYGFIPFVCALSCKSNKKGIVDFVDAGYDEHDPADAGRHNFGQGLWKKVDPSKHFSYLNTNKHINVFVMRTDEFVQRYKHRKYDYIYVDGDHTYPGVKFDYLAFWQRLNRGGFMVFHDAHVVGKFKDITYGAQRVWDQIKRTRKAWIEFPNIDSGLGIIQKL